ncbi:predicted protein [Aspergillus nidulans FGSC A4]|uniref:Uncharacterized protein n=1 Tax=Emericella nidulans (strain FGSC A4 / ATCC 38163 / CBS 112.46 / NRRL 194 / M139) TaxID=227321 RepID=Q5BFY6_EMENI|nr:hypothetical protein [Aspergillus nidulans FGSC A4]EAA66643.1 predicted protein [Aspergillus nidulans FGSC A4]CBF89270.1 TPA: conserved hypothetical protein [Aspergillus nidulans FGSC A4]|eukprot:XP_658148.1 predicted protein [Aspergillus nidulans FGSC A4]
MYSIIARNLYWSEISADIQRFIRNSNNLAGCEDLMALGDRLREGVRIVPSTNINKNEASQGSTAKYLCNSRISVERIDESTVILLTDEFSDTLDPDADDQPERYRDNNHICNLGSGIEEYRVWKTTRVYELIENHQRLVRFIARDPWTALPILEKPWSTLEGFMRSVRCYVRS